ncbi:MAG: tRNA 2-thiouridine(34) synthase MnmA [Bacteroidota bacterium]|nr:tRNA 2-thiouridine(34) synthase MnmA [Candidatus Kapabacteria bacterium]MDW8271116.1 tRNA 2-thiouridine(34) synthase MnmA [Bacteroidota bacterium]
MKLSERRVLVGMSGGVDSSAVAALLVEQGFEVIGITIKTYDYELTGGNVGNESSCCSLDGINDARRVALYLGIPHYVVDFTLPFKSRVIDYFTAEYMAGRTPNPCVQCNRHIKWGELLRKADMVGAAYIATGHYARIRRDETSCRYILSRGRDKRKDQSYALWALTQEQLSRTLFPLAEWTKEETRSYLEQKGIPIARKHESFELCFVPDNDYRRFLSEVAPESKETKGPILRNGQVIGEHQGYPFYTIGQRRGLGLSSPEPLYVLDILPEHHAVVVGTEDELYHRRLIAESVNTIKYSSIEQPRDFEVKIRYKDDGAPAKCWISEDGILQVDFHFPRRAITPGQSAVVYEGDDVVAGGIITGRFD